MIMPPNTRRPTRGAHRLRAHEPDWPSFTAGIAAFLLVAAVCLYVVARLAH